MRRQIFLAMAAMALLLMALQSNALAQKPKVGDRVGTPTSGEALEKGIIKEVGKDNYENCYLVLFDYQKNSGAKGNWVCTYGQRNSLFVLDTNDKRLRDVNALAENQTTPPADETKPAETKTDTPKDNAGNKPAHTGQRPELCGGELLLKPNLKGRAASAALFKDVIKSLWDKDKDNKGWGRRVARVDNLTVGAAYRWRPGIDFQSLGTKPKTVHPVKAKYTTCEEQMLEWRVTETTNEEIYSCYVEDEFGAWTCAVRTAAEFKETYFDKPEKKKITGDD